MACGGQTLSELQQSLRLPGQSYGSRLCAEPPVSRLSQPIELYCNPPPHFSISIHTLGWKDPFADPEKAIPRESLLERLTIDKGIGARGEQLQSESIFGPDEMPASYGK
jgi:hypothetical protein